MSRDHGISVINVSDKRTEANANDFSEDGRKEKPADFETAIAAAGYGKFQYLLLLAIIPVSWGTSIDTGSAAIILPSAECDLQMSFFQKGVLNAITFVGMVASGYLWGYISDVRGRKNVVIYGCIADGVCNILSGFSQDFWTLAGFKFLSGFIVSGPHASMVTYISEFYGIKGRVRIPLIVGFSITFGNIVTAVLAWIIIPQGWSMVLWDGAIVYNSWRIYLSVCGVPMLVGAVCLSLFPESPKFLMSQDRMEDALDVFRTIYGTNTGKSKEEYPIHHLENEFYMKSVSVSDHDGKFKKKAIFFHPYLSRLALVTCMQFGSIYVMNTIRLWQPQLFTILDNFDPASYNLSTGREPTFCEILDLSTVANSASANVTGNATCTNSVVNPSIYTNTVIITAFGGFFLISASFALNFLNHKILLHASYGVSLVCIVSIIWSTNTLVTLLLTSLFVGLTNTTLHIIVGATVLMFPTSLRTIAVSLVMTVGRIGSIIGNILFPVLLAKGCLAPVIQLACFVLLCIVLTCFLPMSKKKGKQ